MSSRKDARSVWLEEGLNILTAKGPASLTIENLTNATGKTKGSFYHHFSSREQYIEQLFEYHEKATIDEVIEDTSQGNDHRAQFRRLAELAFRISSDLELVIRAWALYDPKVRAFMDRMDKRRLEHVKNLHTGAGLGADKAQALAYRDYAIFLGLQQLRHHLSDTELRKVLRGIYIGDGQ